MMQSKQQSFLVALLLLVCCLAAYGNSFHNQPIIDDADHLSQRLTGGQAPAASQAFEKKFYRPVVTGTAALVGEISQGRPVVYHGLILIFFYVYCWLLYDFTRRLTGNTTVSMIAVLLFAVHPINQMSAAYLTGGLTSLYAPLLLGSLSLFLSAQKPHRASFKLLSLALYLLAVLSHEVSILFPVYLALIVLAQRPAAQDGTGTQTMVDIVRQVGPYAGMGAGYLIWRLSHASLIASVIRPGLTADIAFIQLPATFAKLFGWYIQQLLWPARLTYIWSVRPVTENLVLLNGAVLTGLGILIVFLYRYRQKKEVLIPLAFFLIGFFPALGAAWTMPYIGLIIEPHWFYFSSLGFFIIAALALNRIGKKLPRTIGIMVFVVILLGLCFTTRRYNALFRDQEAYSRHWLTLSPDNPVAWFYLADAKFKEGDLNAAEGYYQRSFLNHALDAQVLNNLGLIAYARKDYTGALRDYDRALALNPNYALCYNNKGLALKMMGKEAEAEMNFQTALGLEPALAEPRMNLADMALARSDDRQALAYYNQNLEFRPRHEPSLYGRIAALLRLQEQQELLQTLTRINMSASSADFLLKTAVLLAANGYPTQAYVFFETALRKAPDNVEIATEFGKLLGNLGHYQEAMDLWEHALALDPQNTQLPSLIDMTKALQHDDNK